MRAATRATILFAIAIAAGVSGACAQANSGLYGNLTLGVDGSTVTGVFSDARPGNGTEDAPQFSCLFVLLGMLGSGPEGTVKVTVWSPLGGVIAAQLGGAQTSGTQTSNIQTSGTLTLAKDTAKLRLEGNPPGCAATGDEFASAAYEEPSVMDGKWSSVRLVNATTADVRQAPVNSSPTKTRLSKGDVVVIYRRIGPWLDGENLNARRAVRGWLRESDLASAEP
jgi:hypothetical protein